MAGDVGGDAPNVEEVEILPVDADGEVDHGDAGLDGLADDGGHRMELVGTKGTDLHLQASERHCVERGADARR